MRNAFLWLRVALSSLRLIPHIIVLIVSPGRDLFWADMERWGRLMRQKPPRGLGGRLLLFVRAMTLLPEFRNVFYLRVGLPGKLFGFLCPKLSTLYLVTDSDRVGPGLFIQHGFATIVSAERIGKNCWINQQVTVGYSNLTDRPTIGDNVTIHAGAKIIGKVKIGDNAKIGANSVVTRDVPPNVTVMGVPAAVVWRHPTPGPETASA
jgi:serine O-acetyltransferase